MMSLKEIESAAYELLDDFHYIPEDFLRSSGWIFTLSEQYLIYFKMLEIQESRLSEPFEIPL